MPTVLRRRAVLVGVCLAHLVAEAGLADTKVLGELRDRFIALAREIDGPLAELNRLWCCHGHALPIWHRVNTGHVAVVRGEAQRPLHVSLTCGNVT
jgi:hypothetical protein